MLAPRGLARHRSKGQVGCANLPERAGHPANRGVGLGARITAGVTSESGFGGRCVHARRHARRSAGHRQRVADTAPRSRHANFFSASLKHALSGRFTAITCPSGRCAGMNLPAKLRIRAGSQIQWPEGARFSRQRDFHAAFSAPQIDGPSARLQSNCSGSNGGTLRITRARQRGHLHVERGGKPDMGNRRQLGW